MNSCTAPSLEFILPLGSLPLHLQVCKEQLLLCILESKQHPPSECSIPKALRFDLMTERIESAEIGIQNGFEILTDGSIMPPKEEAHMQGRRIAERVKTYDPTDADWAYKF